MVEPVTTAGAAAAGATGVTGAIGDAVSSGVSSAANSAGNWFTNAITAPFRWLFSLPGKALGVVTGAVKGIFNFGNLPVAAVVAGVETLITLNAPEVAVAARVLGGASEADATRAVQGMLEGGFTNVALNAAGHGVAVAGLFGAASGASEGAGGGLTGLLAGVGVAAGGVFVANRFLSPDVTPATNPGGRTASDARHA